MNADKLKAAKKAPDAIKMARKLLHEFYTPTELYTSTCVPPKPGKTPRPQADKDKMELLLGMYSNLIVTSPLKIIVRSLGPDPHEKRKRGSGSPYTQSKVSITSAVWLSMQLAM